MINFGHLWYMILRVVSLKPPKCMLIYDSWCNYIYTSYYCCNTLFSTLKPLQYEDVKHILYYVALVFIDFGINNVSFPTPFYQNKQDAMYRNALLIQSLSGTRDHILIWLEDHKKLGLCNLVEFSYFINFIQFVVVSLLLFLRFLKYFVYFALQGHHTQSK